MVDTPNYERTRNHHVRNHLHCNLRPHLPMKAFIQFCMSRLRHRDAIFESERLQAWHHRANVTHRFSNGVLVEISLTEPKNNKNQCKKS